MYRVRLGIPWDCGGNRLVTVTMPLLGMTMALSFMAVMVLATLRAFPTLHVMWGLFPLGALILFASTYLGTIQYYASLPVSIRVTEFLLLVAAGSHLALGGSLRFIDFVLNLGIILGAWGFALNLSMAYASIWPDLRVPGGLEDTTLAGVLERANITRGAERERNTVAFVKSYRGMMFALGRAFLVWLPMLTLIRVDDPEPLARSWLSGASMAVFCASILASWACTGILLASHDAGSGAVRLQEGLHRKRLANLSRILVPLMAISLLLPAGLAPTASSNLGGLGSRMNGFFERLTDIVGKALVVSVPPPQERPVGTFAAKTLAYMLMGFKFLNGLIKSPTAQEQWDTASILMTLVAIMLLTAFLVTVGYILVVTLIRAINWARGADIPIPVIPWRFIASLVLWPIGLYKAIKWLVLRLVGLASAWLAGGRSGDGDGDRPGWRELARLFGMHFQAALDIPRDPRAFIRFVFGRVVSLAKRHGAGGKGTLTPREYASVLSARFPGANDGLGEIRTAYERIRYGAKPTDPGEARRVNRSFGAVRETMRRNPDQYVPGREDNEGIAYEGPEE